jgi:para-aminobenzoate synthetase/4-amino-4-deoxychorismate lyase
MSVNVVADPDRVEAVVRGVDDEWLHFTRPSMVIQTYEVTNVVTTIATIEQLAIERRAHAVGFLTYEAGGAFGLRTHHPRADLPVAWFAIFDTAPTPLRHMSEWCPTCVRPVPDQGQSGVGAVSERGRSEVGHLSEWCLSTDDRYTLGPLAATLTRAQFDQAFARIKAHLADGDTYQVNYTFRLDAKFAGDPRALFADLVGSQQGRYAAFIRLGDVAICSASPELFFRRTARQLTARPMKGTTRRGRTLAEDYARRDLLRSSPKERAENVMIVDMMRNDLGRVAEVGTVHVPELLTAERYPTLCQMTSSVAAETDAPLDRIFAALHPSASVTGAPKVRTMEILTELEPGPRGIYTGAMGYVAPGGDAQFNVAIRTAVVDETRGTVSFGVGSGIVWDSKSGGEYDECLLKAAVLGRVPPNFELLETMRWTPDGGFFLLDRHMRRVAESAEYFGFPCDRESIRERMTMAISGAAQPLRVRLLLSADGGIRVESYPLVPTEGALRTALSTGPIDREEVFLYHKTTNRGVYERARKPGLDEVILWNQAGQVTEATFGNVVVERGAERVTPPVDCGLLAGTFRADLLDRGAIREDIVSKEELLAADRFWIINSVQEWRSAVLVYET